MSKLANWIHAKLADRDPIFVISHERSGTHLALNLFYRNLHLTQDFFDFPIWPGPYAGDKARDDYWHGVVNRWEARGRKGGLLKSHVEADVFEIFLPKLPVVYVLRDPRDTLVSFFHYLNRAEFHTNNITAGSHYCDNFREFLCRPLSDFLALGFTMAPNSANVMERWASHVSGWLRRDKIFVVRYEEMLKDYRTVVRAVSRHTRAWTRRSMQPFRFGEGGTILPRKGVVGGWREYFSTADEALLRESLEKYGVNLSYWDSSDSAECPLLIDESSLRSGP